MTHFAIGVVLPKDLPRNKKAVHAYLDRVLDPYYEGDEWFEEGTRLDSATIGGRWDGDIKGLPPIDVRETCSCCNGTGNRALGPNAEQDKVWAKEGTNSSPAAEWQETLARIARSCGIPNCDDGEDKHPWETRPPKGQNGCNGCHGLGTSRAMFSPKWETLRRNLTTVGKMVNPSELLTAIVTIEGEWVESARVGWWGETIPDEEGRTTKVSQFDQVLAHLRDTQGDFPVVLMDCHI